VARNLEPGCQRLIALAANFPDSITFERTPARWFSQSVPSIAPAAQGDPGRRGPAPAFTCRCAVYRGQAPRANASLVACTYHEREVACPPARHLSSVNAHP
jgi:hypothetical protein